MVNVLVMSKAAYTHNSIFYIKTFIKIFYQKRGLFHIDLQTFYGAQYWKHKHTKRKQKSINMRKAENQDQPTETSINMLTKNLHNTRASH